MSDTNLTLQDFPIFLRNFKSKLREGICPPLFMPFWNPKVRGNTRQTGKITRHLRKTIAQEFPKSSQIIFTPLLPSKKALLSVTLFVTMLKTHRKKTFLAIGPMIKEPDRIGDNGTDKQASAEQ